MNEQIKIDLLREEYFHLQKVVEDFDSKAISIKAWSITGSLAAMVAGFVKEDTVRPELFLIASIASLFFWIVEGHWKTFQLAYYGRIEEIETWFRKGDMEIANLQIDMSWSARWKIERNKLFQILRWPHVALPHAIIFIGGVVLFLLYSFKDLI